MSWASYDEDSRRQQTRSFIATAFGQVLRLLERKDGEDPFDMLHGADRPDLRPGVAETPERVAQAWEFWTSGYRADIGAIFKTFEDGAEGVDEMVMVADIPFYSHCEHHMAAIFGNVTVAYVPDKKIVGLSKMNRVVDAYARRLQVQERLTVQIADAMMAHLEPLGAAVHVKARHLCMESRGVCQQGHWTETRALRGVFREDPAARAEFMGRIPR